MKSILMLLALSAINGCAIVDPFTKSNEAMMAKTVLEAPFGAELTSFLDASANKKIVLMNMEDNRYTDDQLPEYLILDAFYSRLTDSKVKVQFLERDYDTLAMIDRERTGIDLPSKTVVENKSDADLKASIEENRAAKEKIANLIAKVLDDVADQDVVVLSEESCCGPNGGKKTLESKIIANEVGANKSELLKKLVNDYTSLYDLKNTTTEKQEAPEVTRKVQVDQADYLLAYRIYDFGTWSVNVGGLFRSKVHRTTYIKLHVRVVDMKTGAIVISDFMEHRIEDKLTTGEKRTLFKSHASQNDFGRPGKRTSDKGK